VLYAGLILFLLAGYMVVLLIAALDVAFSAVRGDRDSTTTAITQPQASQPAAGGAGYRQHIRAVIVFLAAMGVVFPNSFKAQLSAAATTYLCALYYLRLGERRNELIAQLESLLERTAELEGVFYDRTHIVAYSFGSVVALDALFRLGKEPPPPRFRVIRTLITIGCPFDLIRTYWPWYFTRRMAVPTEPGRATVPARWVNIFSLADVLGSNFRNDDKDGPADVGVEVAWDTPVPAAQTVRRVDSNLLYEDGSAQSLNWWDYVTFIGFRAHAVYWNREDEPSTDCFTQVVETLFRVEAALKYCAYPRREQFQPRGWPWVDFPAAKGALIPR
jgi:pimeloyl-ACP methyl ester carboxylesterase